MTAIRSMQDRTPFTGALRALVTIPIAVAGAAALYLLLLGYSALLRVRWISDRTRQSTKRLNRFAGKLAGTRRGCCISTSAPCTMSGVAAAEPM